MSSNGTTERFHQEKMVCGLHNDSKEDDGKSPSASVKLSDKEVYERADAILQQLKEQHKKPLVDIVFFDVDGTLTKAPASWSAAHLVYGTEHKAREYCDAFFGGRINYEQWARADTDLLRGKDIAILKRHLSQSIEYHNNAQVAIRLLQRAGVHCVLLSGGLDTYCDYVSAHLKVPEVITNTVVVDKQGRIQDINVAVGMDDGLGLSKGHHVRLFCEKKGIEKARVAAIGDGNNDIDMLESVGIGVAFATKCEELKRVARVVVDEPDLLAAVMPLFG